MRWDSHERRADSEAEQGRARQAACRHIGSQGREGIPVSRRGTLKPAEVAEEDRIMEKFMTMLMEPIQEDVGAGG